MGHVTLPYLVALRRIECSIELDIAEVKNLTNAGKLRYAARTTLAMEKKYKILRELLAYEKHVAVDVTKLRERYRVRI